MGKVYSMLSRKAYRFNAENRAHRLLDKDKLITSPRHPSTEGKIQKIVQETAGFLEEQAKKNTQLDEYLKNVYVTSEDVPTQKNQSTRPLPQFRKSSDDHEFGFHEPVNVPEGFCTLRQALAFITNHQGDPKLWNAENIAKEYKLDINKVENILEYFKTFNVYIPEIEQKPKEGFSKTFFKPENKQKVIEASTEITDHKTKSDKSS